MSRDFIPLDSNGNVPVSIQEQTTESFDLDMQELTDTTTLAADPAIGDMTVTLTDTTGFVDGVYVGLYSATDFSFYHQVGAPAGAVITLDRPIDKEFDNGAVATASNVSMNVDGSGTTRVFRVGPAPATFDVDVTRVLGYIQDGTAMDDSLFGGIAPLANGVTLRRNDGVGGFTNLWNVKSNGQIKLLCFDADYSTKAPAGSFGLNFRNTYAGQAKHGVTIRLTAGESLELLIQDNLTGLEDFRAMAQGHRVEN
jgi:hypothetical protein